MSKCETCYEYRWEHADDCPSRGEAVDHCSECGSVCFGGEPCYLADADGVHRGSEPPAGEIVRGRYVLPHQSQTTGRDLCAELIARNWGATARGYRLTAAQRVETVPGTMSPRWQYEYTITAPGSAALSWCAFRTLQQLQTWANAYGLTIEGGIAPGESFRVVLPADRSAFAPVTSGRISFRYWPGVVTIHPREWARKDRHGYTSTMADGSRWILTMDDRGATVLQPVDVSEDPRQFCEKCHFGPFFYVPGRTHPTQCLDCAPTTVGVR